MTVIVIEGEVIGVARSRSLPCDRPRWAQAARTLGMVGVAVCTALAALLLRHRRARVGPATAVGAIGGFAAGRRGVRQSNVWRVRVFDRVIVARMASGAHLDGVVAVGDHLALRGRFGPGGLFHAYRGVDQTVGLELSPDHLDPVVLAGLAIATWLVLVVLWCASG